MDLNKPIHFSSPHKVINRIDFILYAYPVILYVLFSILRTIAVKQSPYVLGDIGPHNTFLDKVIGVEYNPLVSVPSYGCLIVAPIFLWFTSWSKAIKITLSVLSFLIIGYIVVLILALSQL